MGINNIISYFIIYSFLGWVLESVFKTIYAKKLINSGFLYGPVCPIYGFGALIMLLFLKQFRNNIILLFLIGFIVLSVWEYIVGVLLEKAFNTKYWDYSENKFNIKGRVCLRNSCFWGVLGVIFIIFIHPPIENVLNKIVPELLLYANIIMFSIIIIDYIFSVIKIYNINVSIKLLNDVTKNIKEELEKLKGYAENKLKEHEKLQLAIEELKEKQENIKLKLNKQTLRLKKAFPTMKLLKLSELINEKIESIRKK